MRAAIIALLSLACLGMLQSAEAGNTYWSSVGAACTPASDAIQNNDYTTSGGSITVSTSTTVEVTCPIRHPITGTNLFLSMTSKGKNGFAPGGFASITAQLVAMNVSTGTETVIVTLSGGSSLTTVQNSAYFTHTFDFDTNYYFVRVTISSNSTLTFAKTLYGVRIAEATT